MRFKPLCVLLFLLAAKTSPALIFYSTGSSSFNTTAPTGPLADSGWNLQGQWYGSSGIPIAPNYFITAQHIGGDVGGSFIFSGSSYTTTAFFNDPNSDLRIVQVDGTFSTYATLYTGSSESGKDVVMFGRSYERGAEVVLSGTSKGWEWGAQNGVLRWGENQITGIYNGGALYGYSLLGMEFNSDAGPNEATYASGDSGGGVFILDEGIWKLAGINSWADGPYGPTATPYENFFYASLYDQSGYYGDLLTGWQATTGPAMIYASRISTSQEWIASVIPEPSIFALAGGGLVLLIPRRKSRSCCHFSNGVENS